MKRDHKAREHFDSLSSGIFRPLPQPAGGPEVVDTGLEIPWREIWERTQRRSSWWPFMVPLAMLVAVTLSLPSLESGFFLDDYMMIGLIEGWYGTDVPALNLYASFLDVPLAPWWTSPDAHVRFWRPLPSAVIRSSHYLFGHNAFFYHAQFLLLLAALVAVCGRLYRGLSPRIGAVALLLFALDEAHAFTSGVICNAHAVISVIPALLGLVAYLRWRKEGWRPGQWLALLGFTVGLLGGETAFAVMAYPLAYELFGARGPRARRLRAIAPLALLAVVYLLFYKAMGYGPGQSIIYLNPFEQPVSEFLSGLATHLPLYLASLLAAVPMKLLANPALRLPCLAAGAVAPVVLFLVWRKLRTRLRKADREALRWLVPGALGSLMPVAFSLAYPERQLLVPAIGIAPLLASLVVLAWTSLTSARPPSGERDTVRAMTRVAAAAGLALVLVPHLGVATWNRIDQQQTTARASDRLEATAATVARLIDEKSCPLHREAAAHRHDLILLSESDFVTSYYTSAVYELRRGAGSISWSTLSGAPFEHRMTRSGPRTLTLEPIDGQMLHSPAELVVRWRAEAFAPGDTVSRESFTVEILATNELGPTRVAYHFERDLDDPTLVLVVRDETGWTRLDAPELGESVLLRRPERS